MRPFKFTIRVYGLLLDKGKILLSKENIRGKIYTKFPGGGLEFGEGTLDCLKREFKEELDININPTEHFYTTENFVPSTFGNEYQVLSIYYIVESSEISKIEINDPQNLSLLSKPADQVLFWKDLCNISEKDVDLPIDKTVIEKLKKN